ncbi:uncharacterized protein LOC134354070 [Mobula hypostoma]|uniref:uncharacterized protein LOC134354070 n=1 Tax=Mobula hypostoma TaxID=723540 RepID=UPI002FC3D975
MEKSEQSIDVSGRDPSSGLDSPTPHPPRRGNLQWTINPRPSRFWDVEENRSTQKKLHTTTGRTCKLHTRQLLKKLGYPDAAIRLAGFTIHRQDWTAESLKGTGGEVWFMINSLWCTSVAMLFQSCSPDLEHLAIKCSPFYLPREFSAIILVAVYIPSQAHVEQAIDELSNVIDRHERMHIAAFPIIMGYFSRASLKKMLEI